MSRPFRFAAPSQVNPLISRPRVQAIIARRWSQRLVTVVAGPGFGKTALLAAATDEHTRPVGCRDVWLTCEPQDRSDTHLAAGLLAALDSPGRNDFQAVSDAVWARAPEVISLVLDDVHEIPSASAGAVLLDQLVTDLPGNARVVLVSREPVPVATARLAAAGQLVRVGEADLAFDEAEIATFAELRSIDRGLLGSTSGWPALAELIATAGADLVIGYLWEEVLTRAAPGAIELLAKVAVVGGGDDEIFSALAGKPTLAEHAVRSVPLVRQTSGWFALHPLWEPALQRVISADESDAARRTAAGVHQRRGAFGPAIELLAAAQAWDDLLALMREIELTPWGTVGPTELASYRTLLPSDRRDEAEALLAAAIELEALSPSDAVGAFQRAAVAFRRRGDIDGELAALAHEGLVRWWAGDVGRLFELYQGVVKLADAGSPSAAALNAICLAAIAHLGGDSAGVHHHLADVDRDSISSWHHVAQWLRSVAHRRDGDLVSARQALQGERAPERAHLQVMVALLRIDWLDGHVEHVRASLPAFADDYEGSGERVLARDAILELAAKTAFFGEIGLTRDLLARADGIVLDEGLSLHDVLRTIAAAALAVADGAEDRAVAIIEPVAESAIEGPTAWYWRDRAASALVYVLAPRTRPAWARLSLAAPHRPGVQLAAAMCDARAGDLSTIKTLAWPPVGHVRAHLPAQWIAEVIAAAGAAGNPAPDDVLSALGPAGRDLLRRVAAAHPVPAVAARAKSLAATLPAMPGFTLQVDTIGPLQVLRDGSPIGHPDLRRKRVRELLTYLLLTPVVRRERIADDLWPDADNAANNLRVTLSYLQRALQPGRTDAEPPYFVRATAHTVSLEPVPELRVDLWELTAALDRAEGAERDGLPAAALDAYRAALPLWRGEPFQDVPYADWAQPARAALQRRYTSAAVRMGELTLAIGDLAAARRSAEHAIAADRLGEPGYRVLIRAHLDDHDEVAARRVFDECRAAFATLGIEPSAALCALADSL